MVGSTEPGAVQFHGPDGAVLRRSNFTRRYWRPAWDGTFSHPDPSRRTPAILPGFTFHEGRHTQRTWLADDGIAEVARAARLGHRLPGMADVYEHVTPQMKRRALDALQARWEASLAELTGQERTALLAVVPLRIRETITERDGDQQAVRATGTGGVEMISSISPLPVADSEKTLPPG